MEKVNCPACPDKARYLSRLSRQCPDTLSRRHATGTNGTQPYKGCVRCPAVPVVIFEWALPAAARTEIATQRFTFRKGISLCLV